MPSGKAIFKIGKCVVMLNIEKNPSKTEAKNPEYLSVAKMPKFSKINKAKIYFFLYLNFALSAFRSSFSSPSFCALNLPSTLFSANPHK